MTAQKNALVAEAMRTGTLQGLPSSHFIDGAFTASIGGRSMESFDPGRGAAFASFAAGDAADVDRAVVSAASAFRGWRRSLPAERGRMLRRLSDLIAENAARFAVVEALDSGKRLAEAEGDVRGAIRCFEYYAGAADKLHGATLPLGPAYAGMAIEEPVGVAAQIIPWNYPLSTAARGVAPALAAGCCVVLKPAEQTPFTALMLAGLAHRAGLPTGVFNVVTGTGAEAGAPLVAHSGIDHVTFTGSVPTGIGVMREAARNVTRVILELGGKSPVVVLADCNIEAALDGVMEAIFENAGQICSAGSRLIIERSIRDAFLERLIARIGTLSLGHGLTDPDIGPVNSLAQLRRIEGHVAAARDRGNEVHAGGRAAHPAAAENGWFFEPTVISAASGDDPVVREEIFGPVLAVQTIDTLEEAVTAANSTDYALVAGIYTRDLSKAYRLARDIDAGQVTINEYFAAGIEVPFGGNRKSGFGRAKGMEALRSYSKLKSVVARIEG